MRSRFVNFRIIALMAASVAAGTGCDSSAGGGSPPATGSGGSGGTLSGTGGSGGAPSGTGGTPSGTGGGGGSEGIGTGGADGGADVAMPPADAGPPAWGGVPGVEDLSTVKRSMGCGMTAPAALNAWVSQMIDVPAMPLRGDGRRQYFLKLPTGYDNNKPYRVVISAPGCTGAGNNTGYDFTEVAGAEGVVQVGLQWEPGVWNGQCFDDQRVDSIEYMYFERVLAYLKSNVCVDEHRVFMGGHSSGSWLSNQIGCKHGGKEIRAIAPSSGGLSMAVTPNCSELPTPGLWMHNQNDTTNPPAGTRNAITRALRVNRCADSTLDGPKEPYPAMGAGMNCEKYTNCPAEFPVVYCHPAGGGHTIPPFARPAVWQFFTSLP